MPNLRITLAGTGDGVYDVEPDRQFWRYLFAGLAMQGMVTRGEEAGSLAEGSRSGGIAILAREQADALLAELDKEPSDA